MEEKDINNMLRYVGKQDVEAVKEKFTSGKYVECSNAIGYTPLMTSCARGNPELLSFFIARGADVNTLTTNGLTPLLAAVGRQTPRPEDAKQQAQCVQLLIHAGADVNMPGGNNTPLMTACWFGCTESVKVLLANGANISVRINDRTAVDDAKRFGERYGDFTLYEFLTNGR